MARVGGAGSRWDNRSGSFAALVEAMLYQQITGKAAATIHRRLCELVGGRVPRPRDFSRLPTWSCGEPLLAAEDRVSPGPLGPRPGRPAPCAACRASATRSVIEALTAVKGSAADAERFLIFRLGRLDVLPVDDYGVRKAMQKAYRMRKLPKPDRMRRVGEAWRPYRSIASWYLWRSLAPQKA